MKLAVAAALGAALAAAMPLMLSGQARAQGLVGASCSTKAAKIQLAAGVEYCGPAVVVLNTGGRSYTLRNGLCERGPTGAVSIFVGTKFFAGGVTNKGKPYLTIAYDKSQALLGGAYFGGKLLVDVSPINVSGSIPLKGRFKGQTAEDGKSFSGSWDCHGHLYNNV